MSPAEAWTLVVSDPHESFDHDRSVLARLSGTLTVGLKRVGVSGDAGDTLGMVLTRKWRRDRWRARQALGTRWMS